MIRAGRAPLLYRLTPLLGSLILCLPFEVLINRLAGDPGAASRTSAFKLATPLLPTAPSAQTCSPSSLPRETPTKILPEPETPSLASTDRTRTPSVPILTRSSHPQLEHTHQSRFSYIPQDADFRLPYSPFLFLLHGCGHDWRHKGCPHSASSWRGLQWLPRYSASPWGKSYAFSSVVIATAYIWAFPEDWSVSDGIFVKNWLIVWL